ncbi:MAG: hypothetical protein PHT67_02765 [Candidatus Pacebacteria bacterium]|nr:hypothetical protein [Candidatus Paceibacterota bacterium]
MNSEIALQLIFALSFTGVICFVLKKKDQVAVLSEKDHCFKNIRNYFDKTIDEVRIYLKEKTGKWENYLHKLLFKARIFFLKADNKTLELIKKLKQRSEKRKGVDGYWKEIKTSIKKKNP